MNHWFYITPEDYERAASNGVIPTTLEWRVRNAAWDKERAITTPPRSPGRDHSPWYELMEKNGVSRPLFRMRISRGWNPERAATESPATPPEVRHRIIMKAKAHQQKFPPEIVEKAFKNGIQSNTFYARIRRGWDIERAINTPLISREENGRNRVCWLRERGLNPNAAIHTIRA